MPADPGYVGPTSFQAHLSNAASTLAARVNGEGQFRLVTLPSGPSVSVSTSGRELVTSIILVGGAAFSSADILVNGQSVATVPAGAKMILNQSDLHGLCDFDELLQDMAAGRATLQVIGTYAGTPFTITGPIVPGDVPIQFLNP